VPLVLWCLDYRTGLEITGLMAATLFGLWITFAMPWLFERIHLCD
jgi:hypothetical protein